MIFRPQLGDFMINVELFAYARLAMVGWSVVYEIFWRSVEFQIAFISMTGIWVGKIPLPSLHRTLFNHPKIYEIFHAARASVIFNR